MVQKIHIVLGSLILMAFSISAQNVGIGTTSPSTKLEIAASPIVKLKLKSNSYLDTSQIIFSNKINNTNTGTDIILSSIQESGLQFSSTSDVSENNQANIITIKPTGVVTLGSVPPFPFVSKGALSVYKKIGNAHATFGDETFGVSIESNFPGVHLNSYYNSSRKIMATGYTSGIEMEPSSGTFSIYTSPSSTIAGGTASVFYRFSIKRDGNIGINVPNPTDRLEVDGNIAMRSLGIFEFGKGVVGKEVNAGRVGYNAFGQEGLTFVGGGTTTTNRKVFFFAEGGASFSGNINALTTISVGTPNVPAGYKVAVDGKIIAEELRIQNSTAWPDYVFEKEYDLMPLIDVEKYIAFKKHLPDVPSAKDVSIDGFAIGEMQKILLRKIEELTLYIIEQEKRIKELELKIKE